MAVKQNALSVLITQFGMEGLIFFNELEKDVVLDEENCTIDVKGDHFLSLSYTPIQYCILSVGVRLKVFDQVEVLISTEQSGPQHERVRMKLVKPFIEGLSVSDET